MDSSRRYIDLPAGSTPHSFQMWLWGGVRTLLNRRRKVFRGRSYPLLPRAGGGVGGIGVVFLRRSRVRV